MIGVAAQDVSSKLDKAGAIFKSMGHPTGMLSCDIVQADLELRDGSTLSARSKFEKCLSLSWGINDELTAICLQRLADVSLWCSEDIGWTSNWSIIFLVHALQSKSKLEIHDALRCLGNMYRFEENQDIDTAHSLLTVALDGFTEMDVHRSRAGCMLWLGDIARQSGNLGEAVELWTAARTLFGKSLQTKEIKNIDQWMNNMEPTLL
ncbi:hypothetical protein K438DRAFT_1965961 [Mycena galopus ATCC 62051]|nr:hypothetical protein K438DRAFT_1965961 [Mycena galopus ATCC 62051]